MHIRFSPPSTNAMSLILAPFTGTLLHSVRRTGLTASSCSLLLRPRTGRFEIKSQELPSRAPYACWSHRGGYQVRLDARCQALLGGEVRLVSFPHFSISSPSSSSLKSRRAQETKINELRHFTTLLPQTDGSAFKFHLIHEKSSNPKAIPLLLLHGWPVRHILYFVRLSLIHAVAGKFPRIRRAHEAAQEKWSILDCRPVPSRLWILRRTTAQQEDGSCRDICVPPRAHARTGVLNLLDSSNSQLRNNVNFANLRRMTGRRSRLDPRACHGCSLPPQRHLHPRQHVPLRSSKINSSRRIPVADAQ